MIETDLAAFFDADDFASECTRIRAATPDLAFAGIVGIADEPMFDSNATVTVRRLRFDATHDVRAGDSVTVDAATWRVDRVELVVDGREAEAYLVPA